MNGSQLRHTTAETLSQLHAPTSGHELPPGLSPFPHGVFAEEQIFRIDHFLGKEAAQSILAMRFANGLFEPIWNRNHIESPPEVLPYDQGSWGPDAVHDVIRPARWRLPFERRWREASATAEVTR